MAKVGDEQASARPEGESDGCRPLGKPRVHGSECPGPAVEPHDCSSRGAGHVHVTVGPSTRWLDACLALDAKGFIKTGPDLSAEDLADAGWPLARAPRLLETSRPGVFAIGDVRSGSVKRVASAVGEGSIAIAAVHQVLHE
jgi:NADPH-dependent glutamate synthase beta subunit-like oxidoreductase